MSRYVLIDYMHLAHRCIQAEPLSATVKIGDEVRVVDTTIPAYTIKNVHRYGGQGRYFTGVCFEGGSSRRKQYFSKQQGQIGATDGSGYKGNRQAQRGSFYEGINLAINLMNNGSVSLYRVEGLEADDCIASLVAKIKSVDTTTPIDIITNDADLLPFVDDQVSVYMRGTRQFAQQGSPEHRLYFQVTPDSWDDYVSYASAFRDFLIPYNSMLLFKMLRGDKSDNIAGAVKGYGGVKYSNLMQLMQQDGVDFPTIFRYNVDFEELIRPVLIRYFTKEQVDYMRFIFDGIKPYSVNLEVPKQIEPGYLQQALNPVKINILR